MTPVRLIAGACRWSWRTGPLLTRRVDACRGPGRRDRGHGELVTDMLARLADPHDRSVTTDAELGQRKEKTYR
jgi:hypothetical protein